MDFLTSPWSIDIASLPAGNYLVRGEVGAVFRMCHSLGELRWVQSLESLQNLSCNPLGDKTFYLYFYNREKEVPDDPPPPNTYRFLLPLQEKHADFKHPPAGYEYLDLRSLGECNPAKEFLKELPFPETTSFEEQESETLLTAVLRLDFRPWQELSTDQCYQLFSSSNSRFFNKLRYSPVAYVHWELLNEVCALLEQDIKSKVWLYGAWLMLLQRHQRCLVKRGRAYYFNPKRDARLHSFLGWPEYKQAIIKIETCTNLPLYPMEELK